MCMGVVHVRFIHNFCALNLASVCHKDACLTST
jgi:hypothetical protein